MTLMSKLFGRGLLKGGLLAQPQGYNVVAYPQADNSLQIKLYPCTLAFRNQDPLNGRPTLVDSADTLSLVVPSGASLGAYAGFPVRLLILALYNGGVPVLGVSNRLNINTYFDESDRIQSTTAISASATSRDVTYSNTGITTPTPYKVVGLIDTTQAAAGVYASALTRVTGVPSPLAIYKPRRRTWNTVTGSRSLATPYTNKLDYDIRVKANTSSSTSRSLVGYVDGVAVSTWTNADTGSGGVDFDVPAGSTYQITGTDIAYWGEYY